MIAPTVQPMAQMSASLDQIEPILPWARSWIKTSGGQTIKGA